MAQTKTVASQKKLKLRAQHNRAIRHEQLREKLKGIEYLRQIENDYTELSVLAKEVKDVKNTKEDEYKVANTIAKADCRTRILKVKMDTNFRRLKFILPELKSMELTDPNGNNPLDTLGNALAAAVEKLNG